MNRKWKGLSIRAFGVKVQFNVEFEDAGGDKIVILSGLPAALPEFGNMNYGQRVVSVMRLIMRKISVDFLPNSNAPTWIVDNRERSFLDDGRDYLRILSTPEGNIRVRKYDTKENAAICDDKKNHKDGLV